MTMAVIYYLAVTSLYGSMIIFQFSISNVLLLGFMLAMPYIVFKGFARADARDRLEAESKKS